METDIHFLSNEVIENGRDREAFAAIDNTPPEPVKKVETVKKEEKKGFNWGKLLTNVVAAVAVVAVAGAMIGGTTGLLGEIPTALQSTQILLKTMVMGGTFNVTYDYLRDGLDGKIPNAQEVLNSYKDGALFSGFLHVGVAGITEASPFVKNAVSKISSEMSENMRIAKIALDNIKNGPKSVKVGSTFANVEDDARKLFEEFKKVKNAEKTYRQRIDEAVANNDIKAANDVRYERYYENKIDKGKSFKTREEWDILNERLENNRTSGYEKEPIGRDSLRKYLGKDENELINNNGTGNMYTNTVDGKTVRPDSIAVDSEGKIEIVHDHKHFIGGKDQELFNDAQMRAERDMLEVDGGQHIVTMSSDAPNLNGIPPQPRPSNPLAELSDIYYTDASSGEITHVWNNELGRWIRIN